MKVRLLYEGIEAEVLLPATIRVRDESGRTLDVGLDEIELLPETTEAHNARR